MKNYELVLIAKDNENNSAEIVKKIKDLLTSKSIKINNENVWGSKKLAYPIKKENTGYYSILNINGDSQNLNIVEKALRIDENLLRYRLFKIENKIDKKIKKKTRRKR